MPGKHVFVQGILTAFTDGHCIVLVEDISFRLDEGALSSADPQPLTEIKHFDWEGKRKGERACQHLQRS